MRVPTLQTAHQAFEAITARQADQARAQAQIASGLRVQSPGDDPLAAAQAEQARSRLSRLAQDRRSTQLADSLMSAADGALGQGVELLQSAREKLVAAGNGAYGPQDRKALALELRNSREQLLSLANARDGAGGFIFGGQGASDEPMSAAGPAYGPAAGEQRIGDGGRYAASVDGRGVFMSLPQGNGVFTTASGASNTGTGWIGAGSVSQAALLTGHSYAVAVGGAAGALTYGVTDLTTGTTLASTQPLVPGTPIDIDGQRILITGVPAAGDTFSIAPAGRQSVFKSLDDAIALLESPAVGAGAYAEGLERAQTSLDRALDGMVLARTQTAQELRTAQDAQSAGDMDTLATTQRRSDLEDMDLAQGISNLQSSQTALDAALKSYASLGRQSLFDFIK